MAGPSLYGSFRAGLDFGSGDAKVSNYGSRWGIKGSNEVAEGLTASYKFETNLNLANAESAGGASHGHAKVEEVDEGPVTDVFAAIINVEGVDAT